MKTPFQRWRNRRPANAARRSLRSGRGKRLRFEQLEARIVLDSTAVFNEVMYNPPGADETLEWIELHNQLALDIDLSGWRIEGGVDFAFSDNTVLPADGYLVIAADPAGLAVNGFAGAQGPFSGSLSNGGEELRLTNNSDRVMDTLDYDDSGDWPVGPDGSGATLAKFDEQFTSEAAANWRTSVQVGGTPGAKNLFTVLPAVEISEVEAAVSGAFFVEIHNRGTTSIDTSQLLLRTPDATETEHTLPTQVLAPGGYLTLDAAYLNYTPSAGDQVLLVQQSSQAIIDARVVSDRLQGKSAEHGDQWLYPAVATPGQANAFAFENDVVINEILYHALPQFSESPSFADETLVAMDGSWRYNQTGNDLGPLWQRIVHPVDNADWLSGAGLLAYEPSPLAEPVGTVLSNPQQNNPAVATYYFEREFEFSGDPNNPELQLQLRHFVDDGAVFYLNGHEVARFNMPDGPITAATLATPVVGNATSVVTTLLDNSALVAGTNRLSVEVHQASLASSDVVFGAELTARQAIGATPYMENQEEWIELYNRGSSAVDLSDWRVEGGIDLAFPADTTIAPGQYLVLTGDAAALSQKYPTATILGGLERGLSNNDDLIRLVDSADNPADEVHYYEGGRWPALADGGGASLELRDASADNNRGEAWAASVVTPVPWQTVTYRGIAHEPPGSNNPSVWEEFLFGLLDSGEILVDDVSVVEDPDGAAIERLQDGNFESGGAAWRLVGNHGQHGLSGVISEPGNPGNSVLHVVATGATEHMSNHVETTFAGGAQIVEGAEYEVSMRVRWLSGSPQLYTRLYFNQLAKVTILDTTEQLGTPGAANSTAVANIGPTYADFSHSAAVPAPGQPVAVQVRADDNDGVASVVLKYAVNGGAFVSTLMNLASDGLYHGVIPGKTDGDVVQFYVEGTDSLGALSQFPAGGANARALYQVDNNDVPVGPQHSFRIIMTTADYDHMLDPVNRMTNDRMQATVVFGGEQVYYNVGVRLKGSGFSRGSGGTGFNLRFAADNLLFGVHDTVSIDRTGGVWGLGASNRELIVKHIANRAGDIPMMMDDALYFVGPNPDLNGTAVLIGARYDDVFLESQFENGGDGTRFKFDAVYYSTRTESGDPEDFKLPPGFALQGVFPVLSIDIKDLGDDPNAYRSNFWIRSNRDRDDYSRIVNMGKTFNMTGSTVDGALDLASQEAIDVDEWMRVFAFESLVGLVDTYNQGLPHNLQFYVRPSDNRVLALPWDLDYNFSQPTNSPIYGTGSNLKKIIDIPSNLRLFQGHLYDIIQTTYNRDYLLPWAEHFATRSAEDNSAAIIDYVTQRRGYVLGQLMPEIDFEITTNGGADFSVAENSVQLVGNGWIDVREIRLAGSSAPLEVKWTDENSWQATVPLVQGANSIALEAYDFQGNMVASDAITVSTTVGNDVAGSLRLTELNYNPAEPTASELAAMPGLDNNDFEFLEFTNSGAATISLGNVKIIDGVDFIFPAVNLAPGEAAVVAKNVAAFQLRYGAAVTILGEFTSGSLSNGGEQLVVADAGGVSFIDFTYDDDSPWPSSADGGGDSLHRPAGTNYADAASWFAAAPSPGVVPIAAPSADFDENSSVDGGDFLTWQRGFGITTGATLAQGDSDGDGDVDSADLATWQQQFGWQAQLALAAVVDNSDRSSPMLDNLTPGNLAISELVGIAGAFRAASNSESAIQEAVFGQASQLKLHGASVNRVREVEAAPLSESLRLAMPPDLSSKQKTASPRGDDQGEQSELAGLDRLFQDLGARSAASHRFHF